MSIPNSALYGVLSGHQTFVKAGDPLYLPFASQSGLSSFAVANVAELNVSSIVALPGSSNVSMALDDVTISTATILGDITLAGGGATIGLGAGGAVAIPFSTGTTTASPLMVQGSISLDGGGSTIATTLPAVFNNAANFVALANYRDAVIHTLPLTTSTIGLSTFSVVGDAGAAISFTAIGYA